MKIYQYENFRCKVAKFTCNLFLSNDGSFKNRFRPLKVDKYVALVKHTPESFMYIVFMKLPLCNLLRGCVHQNCALGKSADHARIFCVYTGKIRILSADSLMPPLENAGSLQAQPIHKSYSHSNLKRVGTVLGTVHFS